MKKIALLLLLAGCAAFGQTIERKDGTRIDLPGGKIHVEPGNKRLAYFEADSKKPKHIKFKDLRQARWDGYVFRTVETAGKPAGFYVLAEQNGKSLLVSKRTRIKSRGGFESTYTRYEIVVFDRMTNPSVAFTDENSAANIDKRASVIPLLKSHFPDCTPLLEKAAAFKSPSGDTQHRTLLVWLNAPTFVNCP